jgi:Response regulator receiver domain
MFQPQVARKRAAMRVLLIEDDPTIAQSIELMLKSESFNFYTTDLGEEGVDLGKLYDYDIILLDLNLPDMSGYEVRLTPHDPSAYRGVTVSKFISSVSHRSIISITVGYVIQRNLRLLRLLICLLRPLAHVIDGQLWNVRPKLIARMIVMTVVPSAIAAFINSNVAGETPAI